MKVFVSSTRAGLADERNALPGILRLDLHDPVAYEGFGARDMPSREACLRAVAASDAVVLLLGAEYGARMPDTGVSPTEEEWRVARGLGKPVLVFRKRAVEPTAEQAGFVAEVGDFAAGRLGRVRRRRRPAASRRAGASRAGRGAGRPDLRAARGPP